MQAKNIKIVKQGLLYRPSKLGMNMWVPMMCVLTDTGFFHTFPSKNTLFLDYYKKKAANRLEGPQEMDEARFLPDSANSETR